MGLWRGIRGRFEKGLVCLGILGKVNLGGFWNTSFGDRGNLGRLANTIFGDRGNFGLLGNFIFTTLL